MSQHVGSDWSTATTRGGHMAYRFKSGPDSMCEFRTAKPYRFCTDLVQIKICTESVLIEKIFFISYRQNTDKNLDCVWSRGFTDTCLYFVCTNKKNIFSIRTESVQISIWTRQISVRFRSSNLDQTFFRTPYAHL